MNSPTGPVNSNRARGNESNARRLVAAAAEIETTARMKPSDARSMTIAYLLGGVVSILRTGPFGNNATSPSVSDWTALNTVRNRNPLQSCP